MSKSAEWHAFEKMTACLTVAAILQLLGQRGLVAPAAAAAQRADKARPQAGALLWGQRHAAGRYEARRQLQS